MKENTKNSGSQSQGQNQKDWDNQSASERKNNSGANQGADREQSGKPGVSSDSQLETTSAQSPNRNKMNDQDENLKPHTTGKEKQDNDYPRVNENNNQSNTGNQGNTNQGNQSTGR